VAVGGATLRAEDAGLRERKKELTRDAIEQAALRLFDERGFDQTSIDDIARDAMVSPRTVRRYYGSKEEIVFARPQEILGQIEDLLRGRPEDETLLASIQAVTTQIATGFEDTQQWAIRRRLSDTVPAMAAFYLQTLFTMEDDLRGFVGTRLGGGPDTPIARLVAATTVAVFRVSVEMWLESDGRTLSEILPDNLQRVIPPILRATARAQPQPDVGTRR
jgi:AcrR family transcriptional regulator